MTKFEDNLWAQLEQEHGPTLVKSVRTAKRGNVGRWLAAAAVAAVLATGAAVAPGYFGGAPPAYALVDNPDGSVTLTIREVQAFDAATAELRGRGIRAFAVPMRVDCPMTEYSKMQGLGPKRKGDETRPVEWDPRVDMYQVKIYRDRIPADAKIVLSAIDFNRNGMELYIGFVRGEMPVCVPGGEPPQPISSLLPTR
ncbi:hypothetical protein ACSHWB_05885 [Lentzea sp. HUAS TT2]|uniref:hypothetical protein n=1 Tax=Lentzea sp. HUAS TT2 TaxID=3447454 RepID=UPI003F71EA4A